MKNYKFKTNIHCAGCIANVTPVLDNHEMIEDWHVDLTHPERILTIRSNGMDVAAVRESLDKIGYSADPV